MLGASAKLVGLARVAFVCISSIGLVRLAAWPQRVVECSATLIIRLQIAAHFNIWLSTPSTNPPTAPSALASSAPNGLPNKTGER